MFSHPKREWFISFELANHGFYAGKYCLKCLSLIVKHFSQQQLHFIFAIRAISTELLIIVHWLFGGNSKAVELETKSEKRWQSIAQNFWEHSTWVKLLWEYKFDSNQFFCGENTFVAFPRSSLLQLLTSIRQIWRPLTWPAFAKAGFITLLFGPVEVVPQSTCEITKIKLQ